MRRYRIVFVIIYVLSLINLFYWISWEITTWNKTIQTALFSQVPNAALMVFCGVLVGYHQKLIDVLRGGFKAAGFRGRPEQDVDDADKVPAAWLKDRPGAEKVPGETMVKLDSGRKKTRRIFRIPGFRLSKRVAAAFLAIFYFLLSQVTLAGGGDAWFMAIIFGLSAFIMLDYVWKTRRSD